MTKNRKRSPMMFLMMSLLLVAWIVKTKAGQASASVRQAEADRVAVAARDMGGVVSSANGPESGVWVIAETSDLPTKFRKIVVTDDKGRFLVPDLPRANYKLWVRGYGLTDSAPVEASPGKKLALIAVPAPDARSAAQIYPANYWFSLIHVPPARDFPMTAAGAAHSIH